MPNRVGAVESGKRAPGLLASVHLAIMLLTVLALAGRVDLARPLDEPFQEGEYAINRPALRPAIGQPVLIHGGLDQGPAWLAGAACVATRQIGCARTINLGFQLLAGWLLVALVALACGLGTIPAMLACLPTMLTLAILGVTITTPLAGQQGAPSIRDLPVLLALFPMLLAARDADRAGTPRRWPLVALGTVAAAAPFWAYNRGVLLVAVAGLFALGLAAARRSLRPMLWLAAGAALTLAVVAGLFGWREITDTLWNIRYWSGHGALWRVPPETRLLAVALALWAGGAGALALAWWRGGPFGPGQRSLCAALLAIGLLTIAQSLDRADAAHLRWTLWPSALVLGIAIARLARGPHWIRTAAIVACIVIPAMVAKLLADPRDPAEPGWFPALQALIAGVPDDRTLAGPELTQVAALVHQAGGCTFAANNAGLVHLLAGIPPCSRFAVEAYVAPEMQDELIATLQASSPTIILWKADPKWAHLDGKTIEMRTPALAAWIVDTYPVETRIGTMLLRSKTPLADGSRR